MPSPGSRALVCKDSGVVVCDCTASAPSLQYSRWLRAGASVVTPTRRRTAPPRQDTRSCASSRAVASHCRAALLTRPLSAQATILSTLQSLIATATRSSASKASSARCRTSSTSTTPPSASPTWSRRPRACYTGPIRAMTSTADVARGRSSRECGLDAIEDAAAVEKRSLVPAELKDVASIDEFMARLPDFDDAIRGGRGG